jgi:hypothetical protein
LRDADFQAGKLDTGYLDRLLAKNRVADSSAHSSTENEQLEKIAVIAAGMFAVLDPPPSSVKQSGVAAPDSAPSNWKQKGRSEALR